MQSIEALRGQHRQIRRPELPILEPGAIFNIAHEQPTDAAHLGERCLDRWLHRMQGPSGIRCVPHSVREFPYGVHRAPRVATA